MSVSVCGRHWRYTYTLHHYHYIYHHHYHCYLCSYHSYYEYEHFYSYFLPSCYFFTLFQRDDVLDFQSPILSNHHIFLSIPDCPPPPHSHRDLTVSMTISMMISMAIWFTLILPGLQAIIRVRVGLQSCQSPPPAFSQL